MFLRACFYFSTTLLLLGAVNAQASLKCIDAFDSKSAIKKVRPTADREGGVVQITGKDLFVGQTKFPNRTPADPVLYTDSQTGEIHVYGTNVDGTGFSFLKYKNKNDLLRGAAPRVISRDVFLPNGEKLRGQEAIWDTYRLPYKILTSVFSKAEVEASYRAHGIDIGTDLTYGGVALQENGELGRWTTDNWRRRLHTMAEVQGNLRILKTPLFNVIPSAKTETAYEGFGRLPFLPGDYIGHTYGPNFKLVKNGNQTELWVISEEVTRRVREANGPAEVTEIVARKMLSPFEASDEKVTLVSVDDKNGRPHPDSNRGIEIGNTKLIEGFRPTHVAPGGLRIKKREVLVDGVKRIVEDSSLLKDEFFIMTGSPGNFAGDGYDAIIATRKNSAIGPYRIARSEDGHSYKRYLSEIKERYRLSWAGRATFVEEKGEWWLVFHGVDKDLKPDGSYTGVIPPNTAEYHRNIYAVPLEFYINLQGEADMRLLL